MVKNFSYKQTKFHYFLTETLGPYLWKMTLDEVGRNQLVKVLTFLHLNEFSKPISAHSLLYVVRNLPVVMQKRLLVDTFNLIQLPRLSLEPERIEDKWNNRILGGKYPNLPEVIKMLWLFHIGLPGLSEVSPFPGDFSAKKML